MSFFVMVILVVKYRTKKLACLFLQNPEELKSILTSVLGVLGESSSLIPRRLKGSLGTGLSKEGSLGSLPAADPNFATIVTC